jgi:hypothetical protein
VVATRSDPVIPLWSKLVAPEEIYVTVEGCNAMSPSSNQKVESLPSPFGYPKIEQPVVAGSPDVTVTDVYQGAQVYLYVDGGSGLAFRSYVDTNDLATFDAPVVLPSGTPALVAGDLLQVIQVLCGQSNPLGEAGQGQVAVVQAAPSPHGGAASAYNYVFADPVPDSGDTICSNLLGVEVAIVVTDDIISSDGFAFQLNAYGPKGAPSAIQQYGFKVPTAELKAFGETFSTPPNSIVNQEQNIEPLPGMVLHAGTTLTIKLTYDGGDNVTGAVFTVGGGGSTPPWQLILTNHGESASDLSPIVAFQVNLVGPQLGLPTTFTSGAGNITYKATTSLTALGAPPPCCENRGETKETGNSVYGLLPAASSMSFMQTFGVT